MSAAWVDHKVMTFQGAYDTRKGTKRDYSTITLGDVFSLEPSALPKERALAMIPSSYCDPDARGYEQQRQHGQYVAVCLDVDEGSPAFEDVCAVVDAFFGPDVASLIYSSSRSSQDLQKWRAVVPLDEPLCFEDWCLLTESFYDFVEAQDLTVDRSLRRSGQPVYLPNVPQERRSSDGKPLFYRTRIAEGRGACTNDPLLASWVDRRRRREQADADAKAAAHAVAQAARQARGASGSDVIQQFNAMNTVEALMIANGYEESPRGRDDWRSPHQTSDSYATRVFTSPDREQSWVSLSDSDSRAGLGAASPKGHRYGDAFDLYVHFDHGGDFTAALRGARAGPQEGHGGDPEPLDWSSLTEFPADVQFVIPGWLPEGVVTLFSAHGGTGKSFLSIYIAICLAVGRNPFQINQKIDRRRVMVYSAEDDMIVLKNRVARYLRVLSIKPDELSDWLVVLDAARSANVLFMANGTTPRYVWLREKVRLSGTEVLIFDNASDGFGGQEIDRAAVRQFMASLRSVAPTVLLLAHVDAVSSMADPKDAKGYSGSTAWHNSARSRWFMAREKDSDDVVLRQPKVNYAQSGSEVVIRWDALHAVFAVAEVYDGARRAEDHRGFLLGLLASVVDAGAAVSMSPNSQNGIFKMLRDLPGFPSRFRSTEMTKEVNAWLAAGLIKFEPYRRPNRTEAQKIVLTDAGAAQVTSTAQSKSSVFAGV